MEGERFRPKEMVRDFSQYESPTKGLGAAAMLSFVFALAVVAGGLAAYMHFAPSDRAEAGARTRSPVRPAAQNSVEPGGQAASVPSEEPPARAVDAHADRRRAGHVPSGKPARPPAASSSAGLGKDEIRRVVTKHLPAVRRAYRKRLTTNSGLSGTVKVQFVIERTGSVSRAEVVSSDTGDPTFDAAIARYVERWVFPAVGGEGAGMVVTYPFVFNPE